MIGVRVTCDAPDCSRHFELDGAIDLGPRAQLGPRQEPFVVFGVPFVALPGHWTATSPKDAPGVQILCAEHSECSSGYCGWSPMGDPHTCPDKQGQTDG